MAGYSLSVEEKLPEMMAFNLRPEWQKARRDHLQEEWTRQRAQLVHKPHSGKQLVMSEKAVALSWDETGRWGWQGTNHLSQWWRIWIFFLEIQWVDIGYHYLSLWINMCNFEDGVTNDTGLETHLQVISSFSRHRKLLTYGTQTVFPLK